MSGREDMRFLNWVWFGVAILVGYVIVILGTSVIWFLLPGKGGLQESAIWELLIGNILIISVGFLAGCIAEGICKMKNISSSIFISLFILTETALFIASGNYNDPTWFVILQGLIIILSVVYGNYFMVKRTS